MTQQFPEDSRSLTTLVRKTKLTNNYIKAWISLMSSMESSTFSRLVALIRYPYSLYLYLIIFQMW